MALLSVVLLSAISLGLSSVLFDLTSEVARTIRRVDYAIALLGAQVLMFPPIVQLWELGSQNLGRLASSKQDQPGRPDTRSTFSIFSLLEWTTQIAMVLGMVRLMGRYYSNLETELLFRDLLLERLPDLAVMAGLVLLIARSPSGSSLESIKILGMALVCDVALHGLLRLSFLASLSFCAFSMGRLFGIWILFGLDRAAEAAVRVPAAEVPSGVG